MLSAMQCWCRVEDHVSTAAPACCAVGNLIGPAAPRSHLPVAPVGGSATLLLDGDGGSVANPPAIRERLVGRQLTGGTQESALTCRTLGPQQPPCQQGGARATAWSARDAGVGGSVLFRPGCGVYGAEWSGGCGGQCPPRGVCYIKTCS